MGLLMGQCARRARQTRTRALQGVGQCSACPPRTSSSGESNELLACKCVAGYTAGSDGVACDACEAGTFKSAVGSASREMCPANSESSSGSLLCYCSAGFTGNDGGPCDACSDCTSVVTFTANLAMSIAEFSTSSREAYVDGVAEALNVASSSVAIASVAEQYTRRRLHASALAVRRPPRSRRIRLCP